MTLIQSALEYDVSRELTGEILKAFIPNHSTKNNVVENRVCLSWLKVWQKQNMDSGPDTIYYVKK